MADNLLSPRVNEMPFPHPNCAWIFREYLRRIVVFISSGVQIYRVSDLCDKQASAALQVLPGAPGQ